MKDLKIVFTKSLPEDVAHKMENSFLEYEKGHGIEINYSQFALMLTDENGTAHGAISAYTWYAEVYVDDLWIDKSLRGKGYGRMLLQYLEEHFKNKGYNNINLVTNAFQAPDFYKKCGYQVEFVRENKSNPQLTKTFFIKYF